MSMKVASALVAVATAALMAACSGGGGSGPEAPPDPAGESLPDPCTLVTAAEVETAIGAAVGEGISELVSDPVTGDGRSCRFQALEGRAVATVDVWPNPGELYEAYKQQQNGFGGVEDVPGLGDDAFTVGRTQVEVLKGDILIGVSIAPVSLANDPKPLVIALGSAAAGRA